MKCKDEMEKLLSNIVYFAFTSKFLTLMQELKRFLIIAWVVGEELVWENSDKKVR